MSIANAQSMIVAVCDLAGTERANAVAQITQLATLRALLSVFAPGSPALQEIDDAMQAIRRNYVATMKKYLAMADGTFAYWGTQLTTPSEHVKADKIKTGKRRDLMRQINAQMVSDDHDVGSRARSWAAEPSADDNGIIDRLTVDENGITIEGGYSATIQAKVVAQPSYYRSTLRISGRVEGKDVLDLQGPPSAVDIEAANGAAGGSLVTNPNLSNANSSTDETAVTSISGWTVSDAVAGMTHKIDTDIAYRGNAFSHKLYGTSGTRRFQQNLVVAAGDTYTPRNYMIPVYVTGTVAGTLTVTWGSKSQAFTIGSLSAGWNYLRLDRDQDLYPINFATSGNVLRVDVAMTTGDASNYINIGGVYGQSYKRFNAAWYGHWSRNGIATLGNTKTFADTDDAGGKNQSALFYIYAETPDRDVMYLRHINDGTETIADYS